MLSAHLGVFSRYMGNDRCDFSRFVRRKAHSAHSKIQLLPNDLFQIKLCGSCTGIAISTYTSTAKRQLGFQQTQFWTTLTDIEQLK